MLEWVADCILYHTCCSIIAASGRGMLGEVEEAGYIGIYTKVYIYTFVYPIKDCGLYATDMDLY